MNNESAYRDSVLRMEGGSSLASEASPRHSLTSLERKHSRPPPRAHRFRGRRGTVGETDLGSPLHSFPQPRVFARRCRGIANAVLADVRARRTYDPHLSFFLGLPESAPRVGTSVLSPRSPCTSRPPTAVALSLKRRV